MNIQKSKSNAALLAFFLGGFGIHRFYLNYKLEGQIQCIGGVCRIIGVVLCLFPDSSPALVIGIILLVLSAITGILAFIDFFCILSGSLRPADGSSYVEEAPSDASQPNNPQPKQEKAHAASSFDKRIEVLERLAKLHDQGVLTDDEFALKKAQILDKI